MRALHQVITKTAGKHRGAAVFAGARVPVRSLIDHIDQGGDLESFLEKHRTLPRDVVLATIALGLEALLLEVPTDPPPTQRSLLPRHDRSGAILNAEELRADQVVGHRVVCPGCRRLVFKSWPEGWDGHAAGRCRGLIGRTREARKAEFKSKFGSLFR